MDQVPAIQEEMERVGIQPNLITFSAMIKGYCRMGDIQKAFGILKHMKREGVSPDEIMYNSLLDGCAQNNLVEEGLKLLEDMQQQGVTPSNFTLSILVKMMNRSRNLDGAFSIVEELTKKHKLRPNVHVYTNLIVACLSKRVLDRAMQILDRMAQERVQPDARAFTVLVQGCLQGGQPEKAAGLLRAALRLPRPISVLAHLPRAHVDLDPAFVNEGIIALAQCGRAEDLAAPLLADLQKHNPKIRIEPRTHRCVAEEGAIASETFVGGSARHSVSWGRGAAYAPKRFPHQPHGSRNAW